LPKLRSSRATPRSHAIDRSSGAIRHFHFYDLRSAAQVICWWRTSRVIPARILAHKAGTGGAVEILLLRRIDELTWQALLRSQRIHVGTRIELKPNLVAQVIEMFATGERVLRFNQPIDTRLSELGVMPLPPYIREPLRDPERYQTVYSHTPGSAAAPTAGLHFTPYLLEQLRERNIRMIYVTLHVGLDTFQPVETEEVEQHHIHTDIWKSAKSPLRFVRQRRKVGESSRWARPACGSWRLWESVA
jgi:S-adenosylmethionine:tRNA ribosyltransferase-isomerase